jgi:hypothetical protein
MRARIDEMLAVVEHEQGRMCRKSGPKRCDHWDAGFLANAQRCGGGARNQRGIGKRGEFDKTASAKHRGELLGAFDRQPRFAATACPGERDQSMYSKQAPDFCNRTLASDKAAKRGRKGIGTNH